MNKTQKLIITEFNDNGQECIQKWIDDGYKIVSMVSQSVSCASGGGSYASSKEVRGKLAIVLEKD
jgi:hypothetical protein